MLQVVGILARSWLHLGYNPARTWLNSCQISGRNCPHPRPRQRGSRELLARTRPRSREELSAVQSQRPASPARLFPPGGAAVQPGRRNKVQPLSHWTRIGYRFETKLVLNGAQTRKEGGRKELDGVVEQTIHNGRVKSLLSVCHWPCDLEPGALSTCSSARNSLKTTALASYELLLLCANRVLDLPWGNGVSVRLPNWISL